MRQERVPSQTFWGHSSDDWDCAADGGRADLYSRTVPSLPAAEVGGLASERPVHDIEDAAGVEGPERVNDSASGLDPVVFAEGAGNRGGC